MLMLLFLIVLVSSTEFCNRHLFTSNCGLLTTIANCDKYFVQVGNDEFANCVWTASGTSGTCYSNIQGCKPSCFVNANTQVANCSTATACNSNNYIGGYGDSQICVPYKVSPTSSICKGSYCDWTCTGQNHYTGTCPSNGGELGCTRYMKSNSTGHYQCMVIGGVCVVGNKCVNRCKGQCIYQLVCTQIVFVKLIILL